MKVYKIRDPKTGLFKNAGVWGGWSKQGRAWSGTGPLRGHLNHVLHSRGRPMDPSWEICEYDVEPSRVIPIEEFYPKEKA